MSVFYGGKENYSRCDLAFLFRRATSDKTFSNNLQFADSTFLLKQNHDAGYDAYMTGVVFGAFAKYFEIGAVIAQKGAHYTKLQNKPIVFAAIAKYQSLVMKNIDTRQCFKFRQKQELIEEEFQAQKIKQSCVQVLSQRKIEEVGQVFREYGDIQVVKQSEGVYWVEFEEFTGKETLQTACKQVKQRHPDLVMKSVEDAIRFPG